MSRLFPVLLALSLLAATPAAAAVSARGAWSRPAVAGATGGGYLTLVNDGARPETLVAIKSPAAERVEVHSTRMDRGIMSMARVGRLSVPAHGSVTLAPGATHLMLFGLRRPAHLGDRIPVALRFASGARLHVVLSVRLTAPGGDLRWP